MAKDSQGTVGRDAGWMDGGLNFLLRFRRFGWEIGGIVLLVMAGITLLALIGGTSGSWVTGWERWLARWFGWGELVILAALAVGGVWMLYYQRARSIPINWLRVISWELIFFGLLALLSLVGGAAVAPDNSDFIPTQISSLDYAENGWFGGVMGWGISELLRISLASFLPDAAAGWGAGAILLAVVLLAGRYALVNRSRTGRELFNRARDAMRSTDIDTDVVFEEPDTAGQTTSRPGDREPSSRKKRTFIPSEHRKQFRVEDDAELLDAPPRSKQLPPLDLLIDEKSIRPNERHINQNAGLIEKTLAEFGLPAKVVGFQVGPTITQFAVEPGYVERAGAEGESARQKVRVSQISALQRDLALALSAQRLRIEAPVPGRSFVGIEVPNLRSNVVRLRPILESSAFYQSDSPLALALGRDVSGQTVIADLARMPHLLIAGTTGSGKSVCISAITVCLAMNNSPEDLRLVMIDPKMVELVPFNGLPHVIGKVETNLDRIAAVLRWVVLEMERRYKKFEDLRARDLKSYNRKARRRKETEPLPRLVVLIDELADLMMSAAEQTEATLVRLAQMGRATGIHLVVATQRPSTDVVTGLIKANFPARLSFAVASGVDSRVILDETGAETLLGRGDMLFLAPEAGTTVRSQGVMVGDQEIEAVIKFWREYWEDGEEASPWDVMIQEEGVMADRDDLVEKAIEEITSSGKANASHLQRKLRIGYPRAARLMDELEDMGIVGPVRGSGREREVLIDQEDEENGEED